MACNKKKCINVRMYSDTVFWKYPFQGIKAKVSDKLFSVKNISLNSGFRFFSVENQIAGIVKRITFLHSHNIPDTSDQEENIA